MLHVKQILYCEHGRPNRFIAPFRNFHSPAPGLAAETTTNSYDDTAANGHGGFFNVGLLTDATRQVNAQTLSGVSLPAVAITRRFDYDAAGRLARERHIGVAGSDRTLESEYYASGALRRKHLADGTWTGLYQYDGAGLLSSLDNAATASASEPDLFIQQILYNARGQAVSVLYGNGAAATYDYDDGRGWLTRARAAQGATSLMDQSYTRNAHGRITAIAAAGDTGRSWTYSYDGLDRLILADNLGNGAIPLLGQPSGDDLAFAGACPRA